jgi:hypothetical protein
MISELYFFIGGYFGDNYSIEKTSNELQYRASAYPLLEAVSPEIFVPDPAAWQSFEEETSKFKRWKSKYIADVLDGDPMGAKTKG